MLMQNKKRIGLKEIGHGYFEVLLLLEQLIGLEIRYIIYL
jgi:hypothetical protein